MAKVPVGRNVSNDTESVQLIVTALTILIEIEREILSQSDAADDEGTNSMMSDFIAEQEKTVWMLKAWLA